MVAMSEHFASEGPGRTSEWARQRKWFIKAKHDHQRREEMAEKLDDTASALSAAVNVASDTQIAEFEVKLESYDGATVQALLENEELLSAITERLFLVREEKQMLLDQAFIMEDGRRVFKAEDGSFVVDEHGDEVAQDELDFDLVDGPAAEIYLSVLSAEADLVDQHEQALSQRQDILVFQEKADAAREQIAQGDISEVDLEVLDADLLEAMPDAVRIHAGIEPRTPTPELTSVSITPTHARETPMQNSGVAASAPVPGG